MKQLQQLLRCRRGGVALMISAAAVPLFLMSALGAEVGSWHLIRRHAQNAADAAAFGGALAVTVGQSPTTEGKAYATKNGFCTTGVGCSAPMSGATQSVSVTLDASGTKVTAVVTQNQPKFLASLVLGEGTTPITAQAVAQVQSPEQVCALALTTMKLGGNQNIRGGNCALTANTTVQFASTPTFIGSGWAVDAGGGCSPANANCNNPGANVTYNYYQPPTIPPVALTNLELQSFPSGGPGTDCKVAICSLDPSASSQGPLRVRNGAIVNLTCLTSAPSCTYIFDSITVDSGGSLTGCTTPPPPTLATVFTCTPNSGVNIVIGSGGLNINGNVNLKANPTNNSKPDLDGVLFYDTEGTSGHPVNVTINGNSKSIYGGAMFFPNGNVTWGGNAASSNHCTEIVANQLTFSGTSDINLDYTGCPLTARPKTQIVLLMQ
jgi:Flp pilus assembly protein TadG